MEEKAILQQDVASVRAELKKVELFIKREAELEEELAEKKRLLEEGRQEHATSVSDLERKHVQEKDRLKKEMLFKLRETKANLLKMTDNQLDTTTKRTCVFACMASLHCVVRLCRRSSCVGRRVRVVIARVTE